MYTYHPPFSKALLSEIYCAGSGLSIRSLNGPDIVLANDASGSEDVRLGIGARRQF